MLVSYDIYTHIYVTTMVSSTQRRPFVQKAVNNILFHMKSKQWWPIIQVNDLIYLFFKKVR